MKSGRDVRASLFFKFICCTHNARKNMANRNHTLHGTFDFNQTYFSIIQYCDGKLM